jgi:RHS repeat-associated protein
LIRETNPDQRRCALVRGDYARCGHGGKFIRLDIRSWQSCNPRLFIDALNRLTDARLTRIAGITPGSPVNTAVIRYDKLGNVCEKNGVAYAYSGRAGCALRGTSGSPHAVSTIGGVSYAYDANGSQTTATNGRSLIYNALNQLVSATAGSSQTTFQYAPGGDRFLRTDAGLPTWPAGCAPASDRIFCNGFEGSGTSSGSRTTHYVGNVEIIRSGGTVTERRRYLGGVAIDIIRPGGTNETRFTFGDHLGSVDVIASAAGVLIEALSFDVHGNRRNPTTWQGSAGPPATTPRGYTGHEHFDAFGFIHMNGRTYDPATGRMLQADPLTDGSPQGLNRYSYVVNNPLALTDPTGYSSWGNILRAVVGIVIAIYAPYLLDKYWAITGVWAAAISGFAAGVVTTGTLKGGIYGAFSGALFYGIGQGFEKAGGWATEGSKAFGTNLNMAGYSAKVMAHGMAGGVMTTLQGGKFGHGFASAGVAQAFSGPIDGLSTSAARVTASAIVGGTASVVAGGKFANGAVTAAFSRAFGEAVQRNMLTGSGDGAQGSVSVPDEIVVGESGFSTPSAAASAFGQRYYQQGVDERAEYQTGIVRIGSGDYGYIVPGAGPPGATIVDPTPLFNAIRDAGFTMVGWSHTHFDSNLMFSGSDMRFVKDTKGTLFLTNRNGGTYRLTFDMVRSAASGYRGANAIDQFINSAKNIQGERVP